MEKVRVLVNNPDKTISIKWDGVNFTIIQTKDTEAIIILNPKEMLDLVKFAIKLGEER